MCAIAGVVNFSALPDDAEQLISAFLDTMVSRGPDGVGIYANQKIIFGHRRLSLLDLLGGEQPFISCTQDVIVVFNGEIYNHRLWQQELKRRGYNLSGYSDGEIITYLYHLFGPSFISKIEGMFAIALYDLKNSELYLYRDRAGEKPLFYTKHQGSLYFSSTINSLLSLKGLEIKISDPAIIQYFSTTQAGPQTSFYENILKVPAAHYLKFSEHGEYHLINYWQLDYAKKNQLNESELIEAADEKMSAALDNMVFSDHPMAITLSGGVDSSLVLAHAERHSKRKLTYHSLSSKYIDDPEYYRATRVAAFYKKTPVRFTVTKTTFSDLVQAMAFFDEPVAVYLLHHSNFISKTHRIALTGNGADESFGGYSGYLDFLRECPSREWGKDVIDKHIKTLVFSGIKEDAHFLYSKSLKKLANDFCMNTYMDSIFGMANYEDPLDGRLFYDLFFGMTHSASLGDTVGMAYSLEYRSPFFDKELMEFAASIPTKLKCCLSSSTCKPILKNMASRYFSKELMQLPKLGCGQTIDRLHLMKNEWFLDVELAIIENQSILSRYFDIAKTLHYWRNISHINLTPTMNRRALKLAIFIAWVKAKRLLLTGG